MNKTMMVCGKNEQTSPLTVSSLTEETEEGGVECGSEASDDRASSSPRFAFMQMFLFSLLFLLLLY